MSIYGGNDFSIRQIGDEWTIYRLCDGDENVEQIILTTQGMDELADYFAESYSEDRAEAQGASAAQREP